MKITFLGATHEVTGSCTLLEIGDKHVLVDCGMEQGEDEFVNQALPVNANAIDCVLVTHAHIDHSGNLPLLYKNGFRGTVYTTDATCNLLNIMLLDSAHIQMSEVEWRNRKARRAGTPEIEPVYDMNDAMELLKLLKPCRYGEMLDICAGVRARFSDIGHLLGSAAIEIELTEGGVTKKIVFSGDIGNTDQPILRDPIPIKETDYLVIESTYGDRLHEKRSVDYPHELARIIEKTLARGGNVIIPSFAVGRTQEILYFIRQIIDEGGVSGFPRFPVYVDSPLANEATRVFRDADSYQFDDEAKALIRKGVNPIWFDGLKTSVTSDDSKALNLDPAPKVILSASGMCEAGRIRHHLKHNLWRPESTILFVGYQAEGTLGRALVNGAEKVKLFGESIVVKAEIAALPGVSGHADKRGLLDWLEAFAHKPVKVFVNHGDDQACTAFTQTISDLGYDAVAPYSGACFDLATDAVLAEPDGVPVTDKKDRPAQKAGPTPQSSTTAGFTRLLEQLAQAVGRARDLPDAQQRQMADQLRGLLEKWERM